MPANGQAQLQRRMNRVYLHSSGPANAEIADRTRRLRRCAEGAVGCNSPGWCAILHPARNPRTAPSVSWDGQARKPNSRNGERALVSVSRAATLRAIVGGERDPHRLATLRNFRCQKSEAEIALALTGTWREEHLFVLAQSLAFFDFYTAQLQACDAEIERTYGLIRPDWGDPPGTTDGSLRPAKRGSHSKNAPQDRRVRAHLRRICGVDLVTVHGISVSLAQTIVAEVGTDMSKFPNEKHADAQHPPCSWLGLAPHNDISGGKVLKSRTLKTRNRAG